MNKILNNLSIFAGRKFHASYHSKHEFLANFWLGVYKSLRRKLPKVKTRFDNNHMGNHYGSSHKPWRATQGI